eukprot:1133694-Pyramimonas_sp.AAC.1
MEAVVRALCPVPSSSPPRTSTCHPVRQRRRRQGYRPRRRGHLRGSIGQHGRPQGRHAQLDLVARPPRRACRQGQAGGRALAHSGRHSSRIPQCTWSSCPTPRCKATLTP